MGFLAESTRMPKDFDRIYYPDAATSERIRYVHTHRLVSLDVDLDCTRARNSLPLKYRRRTRALLSGPAPKPFGASEVMAKPISTRSFDVAPSSISAMPAD